MEHRKKQNTLIFYIYLLCIIFCFQYPLTLYNVFSIYITILLSVNSLIWFIWKCLYFNKCLKDIFSGFTILSGHFYFQHFNDIITFYLVFHYFCWEISEYFYPFSSIWNVTFFSGYFQEYLFILVWSSLTIVAYMESS